VKIMPYRHDVLRQTLDGYEQTGVPLVAVDGTTLKPAGLSDDVGIYELIPRLVRGLDLTLPQATDTFFIGLILVSLAAAIAGSFFCFRSWWMRGWSAFMLVAVTLPCLQFGDVYLVPACLALALVPWYLFFYGRERVDGWFLTFALLLGGVVATGHWVRGHAGTPILLLVLVSMLGHGRLSWSKRGLVIGAVILGALGPMIYFDSLVRQRDAYLERQLPGYERAPARHPLWHNAYLGLGYLENDHGITYLDDAASKRAQELKPGVGYMTPEYLRLLRGEIVRITREDPVFVARTLLVKCWVLVRFLFFYANVGLLAALIRPKGRALESAFWSALAFGALSGVLVIPSVKYTLGFIALAAWYGLFGLNQLSSRPLKTGVHETGDVCPTGV
jgi:hypothetical protein